ncbi:MAG: bifunctional folylpolyglutamate synthase/ dihydrofolate synthase [Desulfovibrio sp.]|nr:bifunctional folylpolyglutamate synthase/ dihydrofolate synthase [Desulfovibrio sp.]
MLNERGLFHVDLSLDRMNDAIDLLSIQDKYIPVIQVVGTNGKGSTSSFIASLFQAAGCTVGLYTSPHFISLKERIMIGFPGMDYFQPFDEKNLVDAANRVHDADHALTYFEYMTLMAVLLYRNAGVDIIVLEAGLGGAHDATTAFRRDALVVTPIALDHRAVLGPGLEDIAVDKARAMHAGMEVFSSRQYPKAAEILEKQAREVGISITEALPLPEMYATSVSLLGAHQKKNAGLALTAFRALARRLHISVDDATVRRGLAAAFLPGRLQRVTGSDVHPPLLLDGAHNPHGMQTVLASLSDLSIRPSCLIYTSLSDKDWPAVLRLLMQFLGGVPAFFPTLENERALDGRRLGEIWRGEGHPSLEDRPGFPGNGLPASSLPALFAHPALKALATDDAPVLLVGSLYLLGAVYEAYPTLLRREIP